ncbi:hypothetical protein [Streptomyces antnestii]|uniref:hypothetical protein n=1 Tax=Streptomyces antnestii TaxID=2494256 RepID=UPI00167540B0|nr:hypothetical protein [Streptomyces sp. San01]
MDAASVSATLDTASAADSRALDRICEEAAEALVREGVVPPFDVTSADFAGDARLICADRYWRLRFLARPDVRTAALCARWIGSHVARDVREAVVERWALGYAFVTRDTVESVGELSEATEDIVGRDTASGDLAHFAVLYHAGKLRSNFCFDELRQFLESSLLALACGSHREEPLFVALRSFAAFGSREVTAEHATALLDTAWTSPRRTRYVVDICLNGLQFAAPFEGRGELLRDRATEAVRDHPGDHMFLFRLASGRYMCGEYDAALGSVDEALRRLPATGSRVSHKLLQEQYLAMRNAIQDGLLRAHRDAEQQRRWADQESANRSIEETMRSSTVRAVELVAVFTAAIAFSVGSLQVTLTGTMPLRDRLWLVAAQGAGLAVFALLVVGGTWWLTRPRRRR